jgi:hypothetical protein
VFCPADFTGMSEAALMTDKYEHSRQDKERPERMSLTELERTRAELEMNVEMVFRVVPEVVSETDG